MVLLWQVVTTIYNSEVSLSCLTKMGAVACRTGLLGISLILLGQVMIPTPCEVFTALVHMEELLDLEVELLASLNSYITAEKER